MSELTKLTISESVQGLKEKNFSVCELVKDYIQNMEAGRGYNAYVLETPERALKEAQKADERYQHGTNRPLEGITLGVKDLFCTKGVRSTACSKILENFVPPYESTVTNNLFESGAIMLGKLNMDEFAMGGSNENSYFKPVVNPWSKDVPLVPGGSSGGSVAAVAAQMCAMATGSDTGGSIRLPASFCGVTGMKPTYGRCSRYGMIAFASSLDQAGPITKDVRDCAMVLKAMSGFDPKDSTSSKREVPDFEKVLGQSVKGLKIGLVEEYRADGLNKEIAQAWDNAAQILKDAGAEVVSVHLPHTKYALPAYYIIAPAEASSNLARYDGIRYGFRADGSKPEEIYINTRTEGFGREVKRRVMIGTYVLSAGYYDAYYLKALKVRRLIADDFAKAFEQCDVILAPTSPMTAFPIGDKAMKENPLNMYLNDVYTVSVNLAGLPALSLPVCLSKEGLPIGMQLIGRAFDEETIFKTAFALEQNSGFRRR